MLQSLPVSSTTPLFTRKTPMTSTLRRQDEPPRPGPTHEVIRCEAGVGVRCQILSKTIWGCWTHWDGQRSRECTGEGTDCYGHTSGWPQRWKGYLCVWCGIRRSIIFLELTPASGTEILRQAGHGNSLRGLLLRLDRHGRSIRAKISVELTPCVGDGSDLPEALEPEPVLRRLWGWKTTP